MAFSERFILILKVVAYEKRFCNLCGHELKIFNFDSENHLECENCKYIIYICSKCGKDMQYRIDEHLQGAYCDDCNFWGLVATYNPPYDNK